MARSTGLSALGVLALFMVSSVLAQEVNLPSLKSAEPDVRLEQLPKQPFPGLGKEVSIPESAPSSAPADAEQVRFVLGGLTIEGATVYPPEELETLYEALIGTEVSLAHVYAVAADIQRKYREDGYFLTRALLPPQRAEQGRLRIRVLEGYISDIHIQGDVGPVEARVKAYLEHVTQERPLKLATLERYLLLAKDLPGVDVNGVLRPSPDKVGAAQMIVTAERKRFDGLALVDNIGSTFTGEWEVAGSVSSNSFTAWGEQLTLTGLISSPADGIGSSDKDQKVLQLAGSFRPGNEGYYFNLLGSYGDSNPGGIISELDFDSKKLLLTATGGYPIIRSRNRNLWAELGFDYINSDTDVFDDIEFSRERLRVLHLTGITDFRDRWRGATLVSLGLRQGLPIFNASESGDDLLSRPDASGVFTSIRADASRLQPVIGDVSVFARVAGQYAFDKLLSDEQFDVGGVRFGRGYNPKELSGDHGLGFTGELQYTRATELEYLDSFQLFGFYDVGKVWVRGADVSASLASAGGGVRGWLAHEVSLELLVAKPLTRDSERADGTRDPEVLFRASARF